MTLTPCNILLFWLLFSLNINAISQNKEDLKVSVYLYSFGENYTSFDKENTILFQKVLLDRLSEKYNLKLVPLMYILPEGEDLERFIISMFSDMNKARNIIDSTEYSFEPDLILVGYAFKKDNSIFINIHHVLDYNSKNIIKSPVFLKEYEHYNNVNAIEMYIEELFGLNKKPIITGVEIVNAKSNYFNQIKISSNIGNNQNFKGTYIYLNKKEFKKFKDIDDKKNIYNLKSIDRYNIITIPVDGKIFITSPGYVCTKITCSTNNLQSKEYYEIHKIPINIDIGFQMNTGDFTNEFNFFSKYISYSRDVYFSFYFVAGKFKSDFSFKNNWSLQDSTSYTFNDFGFRQGYKFLSKRYLILNEMYIEPYFNYNLHLYLQNVKIEEYNKLNNYLNSFLFQELEIGIKCFFLEFIGINFKVGYIRPFLPIPLKISNDLKDYTIKVSGIPFISLEYEL